MAEVLGPLDLINKALPTGVDGTRLAEWALIDGITYGELANQVSLAVGGANQELAAKWGWLFHITEELMMEYEQGGSVTALPELTDLDQMIPIFGTTIGHMLPLRYYGRGVGGSKRYFQRSRSAVIRAAIAVLVREGIWRFEQKLLSRFFLSTDETIGSAGYSVPFVHSTTGAVDFQPPPYDGATFLTTHDHFVGVNLSTPKTMADVLEALVVTVAEHGHAGPYTAIVSRADLALFNALPNKILMVDTSIGTIARGGSTTGPNYFQTGTQTLERVGGYQSSLGAIHLIATNRIPTGYVGLCKSYGNLDARNPLAVRVFPGQGFGMEIVPETVIDDEWPVKQLNVQMEFGVGVGMDRTNGAVGFLVAGGSYTDGTVS